MLDRGLSLRHSPESGLAPDTLALSNVDSDREVHCNNEFETELKATLAQDVSSF